MLQDPSWSGHGSAAQKEIRYSWSQWREVIGTLLRAVEETPCLRAVSRLTKDVSHSKAQLNNRRLIRLSRVSRAPSGLQKASHALIENGSKDVEVCQTFLNDWFEAWKDVANDDLWAKSFRDDVMTRPGFWLKFKDAVDEPH